MLEAIKQWAFTLVITAVVGGLANSFTISENGGMKKYMKFACSAVALAVMVMPLKEMFRELPGLLDFYDFNADMPFESEICNYDVNELAVIKINELLKERIYDIVYEKTGIKPGEVYIYIKQKANSEIEVEKILIEMPGNIDIEAAQIKEVELYLNRLFDCEAAVAVKNVGDKIND